MKKILLLFLSFIIILFSSTLCAGAEKKYLRLGADPVDPNYQLKPGEEVRNLPEDVFVETKGKSGKTYRGWLTKGVELVVQKAQDCPEGTTCWVATRIKNCGNPLVGITAPTGPARILFVTRQPTIFYELPTPAPSPPPPSPVAVEQPPVPSPPVSLAPQPQPVTSPPPPQAAPRVCSPAIPVIGGAVGSLAGLLARNPWTGALLGALGGATGTFLGGAIFNCQLEPLEYLEGATVGAAGGALWRHGHHLKAKQISPAPAPPGVRTGEFTIH